MLKENDIVWAQIADETWWPSKVRAILLNFKTLALKILRITTGEGRQKQFIYSVEAIENGEK